MLKVSVVISVYNKGKYIGRCIDSILNQTIAMDDIEIICVDDKSTDESLDILNSYADNNSNIKIITSEVNSGGPGTPRNKGIEIANGEYIYFVDADDFLGEETLERTYNTAKKYDSDIVIGKIVGFGGRGTGKSMFNKTVYDVDLPNSMIIYTLNPLKLFKTEFLRENNIKFPPNIITGEDQLFTMKAYLFASVISVLSDYNYYYLARTDGYHAAGAYIHPKYFYDVMAQIMKLIEKSPYSEKDKDKIRKIFLERHFDYSRTKNFTIKQKDPKNREEWMFHIHKFVTETIPEKMDSMLNLHIYIRLMLIRNNDLDTLHKFELENKKKKYIIEDINDKVIIKYNSLENYDLHTELFDITYKIRLFHFIENMNFENNKFTLSGRVRYDMLGDSPKIRAILRHRTLKTNKYFDVNVENHNFNFSIDFNQLFNSYFDLGEWDLFFQIKDFKTEKLWRIGNKRKEVNFPKHSSYFTQKYDDLIEIEPFFTKDYDNLSFIIRKNPIRDVNIENNEIETKIIKYPTNIFFDNNKLKLLLHNSEKPLLKIDNIEIDNIENDSNGAILSFSKIPNFKIPNFYNNSNNTDYIKESSFKLKSFRYITNNTNNNKKLNLIFLFKSFENISKINLLKTTLSKYFAYFINKIKLKIFKIRTK